MRMEGGRDEGRGEGGCRKIDPNQRHEDEGVLILNIHKFEYFN